MIIRRLLSVASAGLVALVFVTPTAAGADSASAAPQARASEDNTPSVEFYADTMWAYGSAQSPPPVSLPVSVDGATRFTLTVSQSGRTLATMRGTTSGSVDFNNKTRKVLKQGSYRVSIAGPNGIADTLTLRVETRFDILYSGDWATNAPTGIFEPCSTIPWWYDEKDAGSARGPLLKQWKKALKEATQVTGLRFVKAKRPEAARMLLGWKHSDASAYGGWMDRDGVTVGYVELNPKDGWARDERSYPRIPLLVHELGHALNLAHVDDPRSVMATPWRAGVARETFGPGEKAAFNIMYKPTTCQGASGGESR